jgi:hypothetical protein
LGTGVKAGDCGFAREDVISVIHSQLGDDIVNYPRRVKAKTPDFSRLGWDCVLDF